MFMKKLVIFVFFALIFQVGLASAVSTPQEQLTITVEAGRSYTFQLVIQNTEVTTEEIILEADGHAGNWIKFGADKATIYSVSVPPISTVILPVTVSAPTDTDTMEYQGYINSDDSIIVSLNIRVAPPLEDIRTLEDASSLDNQLGQLEQGIINITSDIISEMIAANQNLDNRISELQEEVRSTANQLQEERQQLQERLSNIDGLTGNIGFGTSLASFVVGVIVTFFAIYLYSYRKNLKLPRKKKEEGFEFRPPKD